MKNIVIIGAGALGREIKWLIDRINTKKQEWNILGFFDDSIKTSYEGIPVLGKINDLALYENKIYAVCAIANSRSRKNIIKNLSSNSNIIYANLIDPSVVIPKTNIFGEGNIICAGSVISVDVQIGNHNIVDWNSTIGHDAILNSFITIYPAVNVSGNIIINDCCELGTGSKLIQNIKVGENTIIGAGAVVVNDLKLSGVYVGIPAKRTKDF